MIRCCTLQYSPASTKLGEAALADFLRATPSGELLEVRGVGNANKALLIKAGITSTHQLLAKFLSFKGFNAVDGESFLDKDFGLGEFTSVLNSSPASSGSSSTSSMPSWFANGGLAPWEHTTPQSESGRLSLLDGLSELGNLNFDTDGGPEIDGSSISASSQQDSPRPFAPFELAATTASRSTV
jgi:hypothetical protein